MKNWRLLLSLLLVSVLLTAGIAYAQTPSDAVSSAVEWLKGQQQPDGSFLSDFGAYGLTADAVRAMLAAGETATTPEVSAALGYLSANAVSMTGTITDTATVGKLLATAATAGVDTSNFGGVDLVSLLDSYYDGSGQYGTAANTLAQTWAIYGLATAGEQIPTEALDNLKAAQLPSGGWDFTGWGEDVDTTATVLQALLTAGESATSAAIEDGLAYIESQQGADGGFLSFGMSNANSTAQAIMAIVAAGQDPYSWTVGSLQQSNNPVDFLLNVQETDGANAGRFNYSSDDSSLGWTPDYVMTTAQSANALSGVQDPAQATPAFTMWGGALAVAVLGVAIAWRKRQ